MSDESLFYCREVENFTIYFTELVSSELAGIGIN
jgi:hypothetical protein